MNWRSRLPDRRSRSEDEAAFRPSRRFLRPVSAQSGRSRRFRRLAPFASQRLWKAVEFVVLVAIVIMLGYFGRMEIQRLQRLYYFQITDLIVKGNQQVPTETIIRSLGLPAHASILEVNLKNMAEQIMRNPWIKTASVSRRLPLSLVIRVSERTPRTVVLADRAYLVGEDGLVLKEAGPHEVSGLPILRIAPGRPLMAGERIEASRLEHGAHLWQQFHRGTLGPGVRPREVRLEDDGSYTVLLGHGLASLRFRGEALRGQLNRLARVLQIRGIGLNALEYADLRFVDTVIVKPFPKGDRG